MTRTRAAFYAGAGAELRHYELDVDGCALVEREALRLPNNIQYAWPHAEAPMMYVGTSSRIKRGEDGTEHYAVAVAIGSTGTTSIAGPPARLPYRPVHVSTDIPAEHLLVAYNRPARIDVVRIAADGTLGEVVEQRADLDFGVFPHQVRVTPDNRWCVCVARGNPATKGWWAAKGPQADNGYLKIHGYDRGVLGELTTITEGDGAQYGPRHLDFHPAQRWMYLSLETQNRALVYGLDPDGRPSAKPVQELELLENPDDVLLHQGAGTVHVHPRGHVVYFANRGHVPMPYADGTEALPAAVENSIVVCAVDERDGTLRVVQRIDSGGICPRTFGLDPSGRMLVAANAETHDVRRGDTVERVPANLATFRVADDGTLTFAHRYDVPLGPEQKITWAGMMTY